MTPSQLIARWQARRDEWRRLGAQVDGARLCEEVLADFATLAADGDDALLTLTEAARLSGYSREHLGRLVRAGTIENAGRPNAPRIRLRDLPRKAGHLPPERVPEQLPGTSKGQIVRSIVGTKRSSR
jgi:hypothetical protein